MKMMICALVVLLGAPVAPAQEAVASEGKKKSLEGFAWLKRFEGSWSTAFNGTMDCRVIGKRWVVNEISFPNGTNSVQTLGYDEKKKRFVGTWVDVSSSYIWRYDGFLDSAGKVLTLEAEGPDMAIPGKTRRYRDTYEFSSNNEIVAVSLMLNDQGTWKAFNKGKMTRKTSPERPAGDTKKSEGQGMVVQYLELVTPDVEANCKALEKVHGVKFGVPDAMLGNARTARLKGGGRIGVRGPMRADEIPVVRPYVLVEDIEAAVKAAEAAGAKIALPPMNIPGHGTFAIYILGGIEHGLWKL